jgi:hypothetical protein
MDVDPMIDTVLGGLGGPDVPDITILPAQCFSGSGARTRERRGGWSREPSRFSTSDRGVRKTVESSVSGKRGPTTLPAAIIATSKPM